jgi:hypothetical protein
VFNQLLGVAKVVIDARAESGNKDYKRTRATRWRYPNESARRICGDVADDKHSVRLCHRQNF